MLGARRFVWIVCFVYFDLNVSPSLLIHVFPFVDAQISSDLTGENDRFMGILRVYLFALSRLMTNIRLAEIAPYSEELLAYVSKLYHWQPALCLDAASQVSYPACEVCAVVFFECFF